MVARGDRSGVTYIRAVLKKKSIIELLPFNLNVPDIVSVPIGSVLIPEVETTCPANISTA